MLIPPVKWSGAPNTCNGGYLDSDLRRPFALKRDDADSLGLMSPEVCGAANYLQEVTWRVNKGVLANVGKIPLPIEADEAECHSKMLRHGKASLSDEEREAAERAASKINLLSRQFAVADRFKNDEFYYPHVIDFRTRFYTLPDSLHWQEDDVARGLLRFSRAKTLGTAGQRALAIHLANTHGATAKKSFEERAQWVKDNEAAILAVADSGTVMNTPMEDAEDPWQFVAAAIEWAGLVRHVQAGGNPEKYQSALPVSRDAKSSGLQHYALLTRAREEARMVGLVDDTPVDLYSEIAAQAGGVPRATAKAVLVPFVYGGTEYSQRPKVLASLKELSPNKISELYQSAGDWLRARAKAFLKRCG